MPYSRATLFEACTFLGQFLETHGEFDDILLRWELDGFIPELTGTVPDRLRKFFTVLRDNPDIQFDGRLIRDLIIEEAARHVYPGNRVAERFARALARDGYSIDEHREVRSDLPPIARLPAADDEVHFLLNKHHLVTTLGHLDQSMDSHARGNWAAANGQLRTFCESLFDEIALLVDPTNAPATMTGEMRRQLLANLAVPFLSRALGEWSDDGKNFVNGLFKRLHPQGSHPGLSDEEDCTFRLYIILVVARLFLRRLDGRI